MIVATLPFDPAAYIDTPEAAAAYLDDALATNDAAFIADAHDVLARAGFAPTADQTAGVPVSAVSNETATILPLSGLTTSPIVSIKAPPSRHPTTRPPGKRTR